MALRNMRFSVFVTLLVLCMTYAHVRADRTQEVIDTIEGILVGAFGEVGREAKTCLNDGEESFKLIEEAIVEIKKDTIISIANGIAKIGQALELLPEELKDCKDLPELLKDFEKIAAEFKDPKSLAIHIGKEILFNGKSIYTTL